MRRQRVAGAVAVGSAAPGRAAPVPVRRGGRAAGPGAGQAAGGAGRVLAPGDGRGRRRAAGRGHRRRAGRGRRRPGPGRPAGDSRARWADVRGAGRGRGRVRVRLGHRAGPAGPRPAPAAVRRPPAGRGRRPRPDLVGRPEPGRGHGRGPAPGGRGHRRRRRLDRLRPPGRPGCRAGRHPRLRAARGGLRPGPAGRPGGVVALLAYGLLGELVLAPSGQRSPAGPCTPRRPVWPARAPPRCRGRPWSSSVRSRWPWPAAWPCTPAARSATDQRFSSCTAQVLPSGSSKNANRDPGCPRGRAAGSR